MKRDKASLGTHLLGCAALVAAERVAAHLLATNDLVSQLLTERSSGWLAALFALMVLRLTVLFVLPGWLAWLVLATALRWRGRATRRAAARKSAA